jgi:hypothetical protein
VLPLLELGAAVAGDGVERVPAAVRGDRVRVRDPGRGRDGADQVLHLVVGDPPAVLVHQQRGLPSSAIRRVRHASSSGPSCRSARPPRPSYRSSPAWPRRVQMAPCLGPRRRTATAGRSAPGSRPWTRSSSVNSLVVVVPRAWRARSCRVHGHPHQARRRRGTCLWSAALAGASGSRWGGPPRGSARRGGQAPMNPGPSIRVRQAACGGRWRDPTLMGDPGTPAVPSGPAPAC